MYKVLDQDSLDMLKRNKVCLWNGFKTCFISISQITPRNLKPNPVDRLIGQS